MPEPTGIDIPGLPPDVLGPTGKVFIHPDGKSYSTHLNFVSGDIDPPRHTVAPLLVPGQKGIDDLLAGKTPTKEQYTRAIDFARKNPMFPSFDTPEDALLFESQWHQHVTQRGAPYIAAYLNQQQPSPMPSFDARGPVSGNSR